MKLVLFLCMAISLQAFAIDGYTQDAKIDIRMKGAKVENILKEIEAQSEYRFLYDPERIQFNEITNVEWRSVKVSDALTELFRDKSVMFRLIDKQIVLLPTEAETVKTMQGVTVTGVVTDNTGEPMPGVNIQVKGALIGTVTDANGRYSVNVANRDATLVFSFIGYSTQEAVVSGRSNINITMAEDLHEIEEVVVVAYGTQKKINLTGSLSTVNSEALTNRPTTGLVAALQGTMPGVTVTQASGQPGAGRGVDNIRIRGIGTMNNSNPMVVIDGIVSSLNDINPDDIENLTVLKDAASAAIYGSRAANGVILITTRRGKKNSLQLNFNANFGIQAPTRLPEFLGSYDNAILANEAYTNEGASKAYSDEAIKKFKNGSDPYNYPNTDWLDLFYRGSGFQQNYYLDMTGGSDKTRYAFSIGYFDQDGIVKETNYKRYTGRMNLDSDINRWLKVNASLAYSVGNTTEPTSSYKDVPGFDQMIRQVNRLSPVIPYKFENGHYGYINDGSPMAWLEGPGFNNQGRNQVLGNIGLEVKLLEGLKFKPTFGYGYLAERQKRYVADIQYYDANGNKTMYQGPNNLEERRNNTTDLTFQALLTYDRTFGKHSIGALAGWSRESETFDYITGFRKNFQNNELSMLSAAPSDGQVAQGSGFDWSLESFFGRVNYNYDNKYYAEANIRRDGSSKFSKDNQWGVFPSFSAGWRISREDFFKDNVGIVDDLKIRGSWGKLGNQYLPVDKNDAYNYNPTYYPTYAVYVGGENYDFGGSVAPGMAQKTGANQDLKWETSENYGVGLDLTMLKQRLSFSADYYRRTTNDILLVPPVSATYGLGAPNQNIGSMRNVGWEFVLGYNDYAGKFHYNVAGNVSFVDNKVIKLINSEPQISGSNLIQEGYAYNSVYGYICEGIFQNPQDVANHAKQAAVTTGPGDLKYKDIGGGADGGPDNKVNGDDRTVLGKTFAPTTFGLNVSLSYGDFDLGIFLQGAFGHKGAAIAGGTPNKAGSRKATPDMLDRWQREGDTAYPRLLTTQYHNDWATNPSTFWLKRRDYMRLKNLQLGYNVPQSVLSKLNIKKARIYYSAQNILTITGFSKGFDPEMPGNTSHPQVMINSFGLNISF